MDDSTLVNVDLTHFLLLSLSLSLSIASFLSLTLSFFLSYLLSVVNIFSSCTVLLCAQIIYIVEMIFYVRLCFFIPCTVLMCPQYCNVWLCLKKEKTQQTRTGISFDGLLVLCLCLSIHSNKFDGFKFHSDPTTVRMW